MNSKKILRNSILLVLGLVIANSSDAAGFTGNGTPSEYLLSISEVAFHKVGEAASTFHVFASGTGQFDIASVNPGQSVGILSKTANIPSGNYDQIRFTVSKTMSIKGASNGALENGVTCRTSGTAGTVNDPFGNGAISVVHLGVTDGATPELETVTVPTGSSVEAPSDMVDLGSSFQGTLPVNFTVTNGSPNITIKFDVTNSMMFQAYGATQCVVFPGPPTITVAVA